MQSGNEKTTVKLYNKSGSKTVILSHYLLTSELLKDIYNYLEKEIWNKSDFTVLFTQISIFYPYHYSLLTGLKLKCPKYDWKVVKSIKTHK